MSESPIDSLYGDLNGLLEFLIEKNEPSFKSLVDNNSKKILLLAAASFFEVRFIEDLLSLVHEKSDEKNLIGTFIKNKSLNRQFHTLFQWSQPNGANGFFALFGNEFKTYIQAKIRDDATLEKSIQAFLDLGNDRNRMVHENFGNFTLEKTNEEIYRQYKESLYFLVHFPTILKEYIET